MLFTDCDKDKSKMPIEEAKMVQVLTDMHLSEAYLDVEPISIKDSMGRVYSAQIFEQHKVSKIDFDSSLNYLYLHPIQYDSLYAKVERNILLRNSGRLKSDSSKINKHLLDTTRK
jgi:Domain of unknown function (DUF4296)